MTGMDEGEGRGLDSGSGAGMTGMDEGEGRGLDSGPRFGARGEAFRRNDGYEKVFPKAMSGQKEIQRTVLVVEDDDSLQDVLTYNLTKKGYRVLQALDGDRALELARESDPDVIVLDIMLPGLDGLEVCRIVRREMATPILILTARDQELDKVGGLELGADDYMTKPFSIRELMARVGALIRRREMDVGPPESNKNISVGGLTLNLEARTAYMFGKSLDLRPKEYDLLAFLAGHPGRAYTRNDLLDEVWGTEFFGDPRTVDVHIRWLREKIEREPGTPRHIITIRGTGYRFEE